ncbi:MAG: excinuclease ABC subunit UvrA [Planctomycetota bacterium]|nr:excinuclease ABC subunit UvrA [Planctomycetota bacterium]
MNSNRHIIVRGAAEHNLKKLDLDIPRDRMIVVTGLSGSGKSSLAFDTIYAEGQRRYVESLSAYARQFLQQLDKPDVERIDGLPPTLAIEQRQAVASPRSTVATTTELYDYLRLLFARAGRPHCPECGKRISAQSPEEIVENVLALPERTRLLVLSTLVANRTADHEGIIEIAQREGFVRFRIDGDICQADSLPDLNPDDEHRIDVVVDRLVIKSDLRGRLQDSLETALRLGGGLVTISSEAKRGQWSDKIYSELYACADCGVKIEELAPRTFSFNSPYGACPDCSGLGDHLEFDLDLMVPDRTLSLSQGAFQVLMNPGIGAGQKYHRQLLRWAKQRDIDVKASYESLDEATVSLILQGPPPVRRRGRKKGFAGILTTLKRRFDTTDSDVLKERMMAYMSQLPCRACEGTRLRPEARAVTFGGRPIFEVVKMPIGDASQFFGKIDLTETEARIAEPVLKEVRSRLNFLTDVGLSYLTLDRQSSTLSGGEWQRIRLATQVGSGLVGVCYVLDEPTIGLHARDNEKLIATLQRLRDLGNTVIVVEHDEQTIRAADYILDLGPGAGTHGGEVIASGTLQDILDNKKSLTGKYLANKRKIEIPANRRALSDRKITIAGARENNLKDVTIDFPLGGLICVTGVSGSGKSTLVRQTLLPALKKHLYNSRGRPGDHDEIIGLEQTDKVIEIDQSPIGRTPRSNPATYTGLYNHVRTLFAKLKDAKVRGYTAGRFSFNVKGGRCEACEGQGARKIPMHFLPDIFVPCEICRGKRFNRETLEVKFRGYSIADVLGMTVDEALPLFKNIPIPQRILQTLLDVGLSYVALGQSSTTLSGGEAQRVKLASELAKRSTGHTLYILDEPTTGLHFEDSRKLLEVLNRLADMGNTLIVIEHNLDIIKCADWVIDLGPDGGEAGGEIIATGTPEAVAEAGSSATGKYLRDVLKKV